MGEFLIKVDKTLRYHAKRALQRVRTWRADRNPPRLSRPVFVVGCSRAGTTLVYKTFSQSEELGSLNRETHAFWDSLHPVDGRGWNTHALGAVDASEADRLEANRFFYIGTGRTTIVDKNNQNGLCIPYLLALYPDARFVFVKRAAGDNIHSLIEGWKRPAEYATWSDHLPEKVSIDGGTFQRWCFFLADGWRDYLNAPIEEVCAFQYRAMNEAILDAKALVPPGQWAELRYEDLLQDHVAGFRRAFLALGLGFSRNLEAHCADVLNRPYNAFSEIKLDKWRGKGNCDRIERILPSLADLNQRLGYTE